MAKQYGDSVQLIRNGVTVNALVAMSSQQADGEHLSLIYLDPKSASTVLTSMQLDAAIKKEFGVTAYADGKPVGFKEPDTAAEIAKLQAEAADNQAALVKQITDLQAALAASQDSEKSLADQVAALTAENDTLKNPPAPPAPPEEVTDAAV